MKLYRRRERGSDMVTAAEIAAFVYPRSNGGCKRGWRNKTAGIGMSPAVVALEKITGRTNGVLAKAVLRVHTVGTGELNHLIVNTK
jgi:hypothetical protein